MENLAHSNKDIKSNDKNDIGSPLKTGIDKHHDTSDVTQDPLTHLKNDEDSKIASANAADPKTPSYNGNNDPDANKTPDI